jgi:hypothetical protein
MATIALILRGGSWVPALPSDIRKGDTFQLIVRGEMQAVSRALGTPTPIIISGNVAGWDVECEPALP